MVKKASNLRFLCINVLIAVVLIVIGLVVVVMWLIKYTDHGHEIEVPQVTGLYQQEAESLLSSSHLNLVVIDSTFSKKVPLGTIVEQNPPAGSNVKNNRSIYVVINASSSKQIMLPELHDISYRQVENMLRQLGLNIGEIIYEPSEYRDLVLDVRIGEQSLEVGNKVAEGTTIDLVVGQGQGSEMVRVPDVNGMKLAEARSMLLSQHLTVGRVAYDEKPSNDVRDEYVVYKQEPQAGSMILEGGSIRIYLSSDLTKAVTSDNLDDEEEFF